MTLLQALCLMFKYQREGEIKPPLLKTPCHIICQLGGALDGVGGVKAVFLEPTFRLNFQKCGEGGI